MSDTREKPQESGTAKSDKPSSSRTVEVRESVEERKHQTGGRVPSIQHCSDREV